MRLFQALNILNSDILHWKKPLLHNSIKITVLKTCYKANCLTPMQHDLTPNATWYEENEYTKIMSIIFFLTIRCPTSVSYTVFTPSSYKVYLSASSNHRTPVASSIPARAVVGSCGNCTNLFHTLDKKLDYGNMKDFGQLTS